MFPLKNAIKKFLLGNIESQEYICTPYEKLTDTVNVFFSVDEKQILSDVTSSHVFLGYKPLIVGVSFNPTDEELCDTVRSKKEVFLLFKQTAADHKVYASLHLKMIIEKKFKAHSFFIFKGVHGTHSFLLPFHQFTNTVYEKLKRRAPGNIDLSDNLHQQVAIAYSLPRIISIITVGENNLFNVFPTDLHGRIDDENYVSSLRHGGKACSQVQKIKKIVLANVSSDFFREAYALGKNHMQELKPESNFNTALKSELLNYPLVAETLSYKEMEVTDHFDVGMHRILFYKILNEKTLKENSFTLSHLHQYYVQWRQRKGLFTERLLR